MKKTLSIVLIAVFCLGLFFTQVFACGTPAGVSAKPTAKPNGTPEVGVPDFVRKQPGKPDKHPGKKFNFKGEVVSFDGGSLVLTDKRGETVTVAVDAGTVIKTAGSKDSPAAVQPGDRVTVGAVKTENESYLALRIVVIPGKPQKVHRVGVVTAYEAGVSITVEDSKGSTTFVIAEDVKILPEERAGDLKVGARVTIISPRDPSGGTVVARGIVVHPAVDLDSE